MSLLQNATKLNQIIQIHALIIKTSLDGNNFVLAKLLRRLFACSSANDLLYARSVFDEIPSPDTFIWNTMIRAYLNSQNPQESMSLFFQMRHQECIPIDSYSLSLVIQACGRLKDPGNGQKLHTQVLKIGLGSDLFVETALIEMYAKFGDIEIARNILDEMAHPDLRDLVSWNTMIHGHASLGDSNEALRLFHEMQLANVLPDKVTMVSVLSACGDVGALGMGKMIHECIERNRIEIDLKLGTSLVDMYAKCGDIDNSLRWDKVVNVRRMMKNINIQKVPGSSSIEVDNAVHEFVAGDQSHPESKKILRMLSEITARLKANGYAPLTASVLQDFDEKEKENALAHHSEKLAIAFGLLSTAPGSTIRIVKNLRVCDDCHIAIKLISRTYKRRIIVRDRNRFHHFVNGSCSCKDYW
ncbi:unnamed protein product, partial [Vitis vinifera]